MKGAVLGLVGRRLIEQELDLGVAPLGLGGGELGGLLVHPVLRTTSARSLGERWAADRSDRGIPSMLTVHAEETIIAP